MSVKLKIILLVVFVFIAVYIVCFKTNFLSAYRQPVCKDCNVILISLDTLSANHLPCYGYRRNTAPNLCQFGKENIMFENMYSNASWTLPSHVSLFTGLLPSQHRVIDSYKDRLSPTVPFMPDILQKNGYKTYFYMKLGSNSLPEDFVYYRGIDELHNVTHPNDWNPGLERLLQNNKNHQKTFLFLHTYWVHMPYLLEHPNRKLFTEGDSPPANIPTTKAQLYTCSDTFLKGFIETLQYDLGPNSENFWNPPQKPLYEEIYKKLLSGNAKQQRALCSDPKYEAAIKLYMEGAYESEINTADAKQVQYLVDAYDSKIKELDEYVKKVVDFVETSDLKRNTVIIITSDHGEEFMEHGHIAHAKNLYDTTIKVPLIMYVPGTKEMSLRAPAQSVDLMPTLLDILNIAHPYKTAGVDLLSPAALNDGNRLTQAEQISFNQKNYEMRAGNWKLHYKKNSKGITPLELYNMSADPGEKNNLLFANQNLALELIKKVR